MVHEFDPHMLPDAAFRPGALEWLVPGNSGRLLDRRRTPIRVVRIDHETAQFVCRIEAFEDRGALWEVPFESVAYYQFARDAQPAPASAVEEMARRVVRFDRATEIPCDLERRAESLARLERMEAEAEAWWNAYSSFARGGGRLDPQTREGDPRLWADLEGYMEQHGLLDLESTFSARYVSNPESGDWVKAHRMVIAELGLVPYRGKVLRDPSAFQGAGARPAREAHVLRRLAFVRGMLERGGLGRPLLYRGMSCEGPLEAREPRTFVSATFSLEVATSLFGEPHHGTGLLQRQEVPARRVFMTFFETRSMSQPFREAEAVLLEDEANLMF
jgi:hypothetical protein